MTILLIDKSGHKRVMEIHQRADENRPVWVAIPTTMSVEMSVPRYTAPNVARFERTDELSYPPVYRQV